jgi:hypothetical protein
VDLVRTRIAVTTVVFALLALPVSAQAVSVVNVTAPTDGRVFYTGDAPTAFVHSAADLSSDCESGTWYLHMNEVGKPRGAYVAGSTVQAERHLEATNQLFPGRYEYHGSVSCVDPEGDTYTTNFPTITVIAGFDQPPEVTLTGKKSQPLGKRVAVKAKCNEACTATGTGTLSVPNASKVYRLENTSADVAPGETATLKLKLSKAARKAARAALESGEKLTAKLKVVAKDASGKKTTEKRSVKLTLD